MADSKITQLNNNTTIDDADLVVIVDDVAGTPITEKRTIGELKSHTNVGVAVKSSTMGAVVHGATAGTARPTDYTVVTWIGSVEPTNATTNDIWVDTA